MSQQELVQAIDALTPRQRTILAYLLLMLELETLPVEGGAE